MKSPELIFVIWFFSPDTPWLSHFKLWKAHFDFRDTVKIRMSLTPSNKSTLVDQMVQSSTWAHLVASSFSSMSCIVTENEPYRTPYVGMCKWFLNVLLVKDMLLGDESLRKSNSDCSVVISEVWKRGAWSSARSCVCAQIHNACAKKPIIKIMSWSQNLPLVFSFLKPSKHATVRQQWVGNVVIYLLH